MLNHTGVTGAGLVYLKDMARLHTLDLSHTRVGDAGLEHLTGLKQLQTLELTGTQVTDAGLAHLAKVVCLREPGHDATNPIVKGVLPPAGLPQFPGLGLGGTRVSDAGLAQLRDLRGLQRLELNNTQVTDAGLAGSVSPEGTAPARRQGITSCTSGPTLRRAFCRRPGKHLPERSIR